MRDIQCTITSLGKISKYSKFYVQNIWQVVRWWHHQLTHLHIHIDWSRNVLWKFAKLQNAITSLFFNRFSSGFHYYVWKFLLVFLKFKLNLFRISPLTIGLGKKSWVLNLTTIHTHSTEQIIAIILKKLKTYWDLDRDANLKIFASTHRKILRFGLQFKNRFLNLTFSLIYYHSLW